MSTGVNALKCTAIICVIQYLKIPPCKSILGLYKRFPSLVIDEIKYYKGGGRGGPFTPEGDSLHQCKLSGVTLYTIVQNVRGVGGTLYTSAK